MLLILIILVVQPGQGDHVEEMEPVIEIEMEQDNINHLDSRREAIKYVAEHFKEIEEKMKGHKKGESIIFLWLLPRSAQSSSPSLTELSYISSSVQPNT